MFTYMKENSFHNSCCLNRIVSCTTSAVHPRNNKQLDPNVWAVNVCAWERDQLAIKEAVIGIRNQILMLTPIVPAKCHRANCTRALGDIKHRLIFIELFFFPLVPAVAIELVEKRGWRELLLVARDDELPAAVNTVNRISRFHLGRFVEYDEIETHCRRQELAN